jgi:hypothetical protein
MRRQMKMAAFALAITLGLSGSALARDDDDYYRGGQGSSAQAHQYGYDSGYRDGLRHGREEARENDPTDFRTRDYDRATNGYQGWMGSKDRFRDGYRDGYQRGYQEAFYQSNRGGWGDRDRNDHGYERTDWPGRGGSWGRSPAYNYGYQDGITVARSDEQHGKPFNPIPRSGNNSDRGYSSRYGDKNQYKAEYRDAYRQGYEETRGGGRRRY